MIESTEPRRTAPAERTPSGEQTRAPETPDGRVVLVHRIGALLVAAVIAVFGILGLAGGLDFFSTQGDPVMGMSSNGLLSVISILTALVLVVAAARSGRLVSTVMMAVGALFLISALGHFFVLDTRANVLAFSLSNIFFSMGAGLVLLLLGSYGRVSGRIPANNPYYLDAHRDDPTRSLPPESRPVTPDEQAVDRLMADAERAAAQGFATVEQRTRVAAMAECRTPEDRRRVWSRHDAAVDAPAPTVSGPGSTPA